MLFIKFVHIIINSVVKRFICFLSILFVFLIFSNKINGSTHTHQIDSLTQLINSPTISDTAKSKILFEISLKEYHMQHYSKAINYANQSLEIFRAHDNLKAEGQVLEYIGIYYAEFSDYENSIKYLLSSLKIAEEQQDKYSINSRNLNLGTTFLEAGSFNKSIDFFKKAVTYFQQDQSKNAPFLVAGYSNLGAAFEGLNVLDSAMYFYQKSAALAITENTPEQIGAPLLNIAEIQLKNNNIEEALINYQKALDLFKSNNDNKGLWHTNFGIANAYIKQGKTTEAIQLLDKIIFHFRKTNDLNYLAKSLNILSSLYENQSNYQLANEYNNQLLEVKDSISKSEIINKMADIELQYKVEKLQKESQSKLQLIEQQKKISTLRWYFATGILVFIIILIITLYSKNKTQKKLVETRLKNTQLQRTKLQSELDFRNTELENFALHIVQKNEFLQDIKSKFKKLRLNASEKNIEEIKDLNLKINQSLRANKELEKFRERVDDVNSHFFNLLNEKYPDLTEKEKRLCALLKMNLSSKEIASLNNISEGAVTMARYRLRKKIDISTDENLTEFFQKLT